jgi:hypothetical protein
MQMDEIDRDADFSRDGKYRMMCQAPCRLANGRGNRGINVRSWHKADMLNALVNVRF